jgi:hypothetical protein
MKHGKSIEWEGISVFHLVAEKLTLAFTMDVCSTEIYQKCPNFVKNADSAFSKANSMMDFGHLR